MGFMDFFRKKNSGEVAKDRLKLLLISDRANCSPEVMEAIKMILSRLSPNIWILTARDLIFRLHRQSQRAVMELFRCCVPIFR